MERNVNESFADYKARRAVSNLAAARLNWQSKGGSGNVRASRMGKGLYGRTLASHFAKLRATSARLLAHRMHVEHIAARKAERAMTA